MGIENKRPSYPPQPPKFESINTVLTKKVNNVVYELMVRTTTDQVFDKEGITLTEKLSDIFDLLLTNKKDVKDIREKYDDVCAGAPEFFNSFKEVWDYVNVNGDPKSELLKLINNKVTQEDGKGLSTNDFTNILKEKLENDYTKEDLDKKFDVFTTDQGKFKVEIENRLSVIEKKVSTMDEEPNVPVATDPSQVKVGNGEMWFLVVNKDN